MSLLAEAIRCYQCASTEDQQKPTGIWSKDRFSQDRFEDRCGVYWPFQEERNTAVECNSDESHTPGMLSNNKGVLSIMSLVLFQEPSV